MTPKSTNDPTPADNYTKDWWKEVVEREPGTEPTRHGDEPQPVRSRIPKLCKDRGWTAWDLAEHAQIGYNGARNLFKKELLEYIHIPTMKKVGIAMGIAWPRLFEEEE